MSTYTSKFDQLHESAYSRYTQGAGFLAGDVVKFKKNTPKSEWFKSKATSVQKLILAMMETPGNLRIGVLKNEFPHAIGGHGASDVPASMADIYVELSPANWAYPMTVPLTVLERIEPKDNTIGGPVPENIKDKKRTQIKGIKKEKNNAKQTDADDKNRQLATSNTTIAGGKKWDDSKVGGGNIQNLPGTAMKESVSLEDAYNNMLTEGVDGAQVNDDPFNKCEYKTTGNEIHVTFDDSVYSSAHDDEVPVKVTAKFNAGDKSLANIVVADELGRSVGIHAKDREYLTNRANDFIGRYDMHQQQERALVDEALGKTANIAVGKHQVTRNQRNTKGEDPTVICTYTFDNGYSIVEFFGDFELKDPSGKRIKFVHKASDLNQTLNHLGLPIIDDIEDAFGQHDNTDSVGDEMDSLMGDMNP